MPDYKLGRLRGKYCVTWWEDGKRHRHSLGTDDRESAQAALTTFRREADRPARITIESLWEAYCRENAAKPIVPVMGYEWRALAPDFAGLEPDDINHTLCTAHIARRRTGGVKDGTIHTQLGRLRMVLRWAEKRRLIDRAPHVDRPAAPPPRGRWLTRDEARRLIDGAEAHHVRLAIILMLATAARVSAVLDLTWDRIDMERGIVVLDPGDGQGRKGRATVPINGMLRAALTEADKAAISDHVVEWGGGPVKSIKTGFRRAAANAGLTDVSPHVLRHTAAVWMAEKGTSMDRIAQYLGHSDSRITERVYARFAPDHLRDEADILDLGPIMSPQSR